MRMAVAAMRTCIQLTHRARARARPQVMCRELEYSMDDVAIEAFRAYMAKRMTMPFFANARTVRNAIDLARMASAVRVFNEKTAPGADGFVTEAELQTIKAEDFPNMAELEAAGQRIVA